MGAVDQLARGAPARCAICGTQVDARRVQIALDADRCQRHLTTAPATGSPEGTSMTPPPTPPGRPAQADGFAAARTDRVPPDTRPAGALAPSASPHPGLSASTADEPPAGNAGLGAELAPFVSWLATQDIDEPTRREFRAEVEDYLRWARGDPGPVSGRRRRYENHLASQHPNRLDRARAGLDRLAEYRALLAVTLPTDHSSSRRSRDDPPNQPAPHRHPGTTGPATPSPDTAAAEETALWDQVRRLGTTAGSPADPYPENPASAVVPGRHDHADRADHDDEPR